MLNELLRRQSLGKQPIAKLTQQQNSGITKPRQGLDKHVTANNNPNVRGRVFSVVRADRLS
jgi:hypothetical protein